MFGNPHSGMKTVKPRNESRALQFFRIPPDQQEDVSYLAILVNDHKAGKPVDYSDLNQPSPFVQPYPTRFHDFQGRWEHKPVERPLHTIFIPIIQQLPRPLDS